MAGMRALWILKTGGTVPNVAAHRGDFEDWIRRGTELAGERVRVADLVGGAGLPRLGEAAGLVVTGSPAMITEGLPWSLRAEGWLQEAVLAEVPLLGICYGHQLLARSIGGAADWNPNGREIGTVRVRLTPAAAEDPLFGGLPAALVVQTTHSQSVIGLPPGATLLAENDHDGVQAFRYGPRAWGVQFHPEFDAEIIRGYVSEREDEIRAEGLDPHALRAAAADSDHGHAMLRRFRELLRF